MDTTAPRNYPEERSLIGLFSDLWRETSTLLHEEAELAKAEIAEKLSEAGTGAAAIAAGGAVLFAGFIVLLFAAVNALELVLETEHAVWLAPLIVGAVVMIAGYIALAKGRRALTASNLKPSRTAASLRQDALLVKEHMK
jgi:hypothetical protein